MMNTLIDISGKLDADLIECIERVHMVCSTMSLDVLVVGALARDMHFLHCHGIRPGRATLDIDFAVLTPDWDTFANMKERLLGIPGYTQDRTQQQRLHTGTGLMMDLIPFGGIESPAGMIRWPPALTQVMSTIGYREALATSQMCRVRATPDLNIRVVSIAGIAALKLLAWADSYPERKKDAIDLHFLLTNYLDAGQSERLWDAEIDLVDVPDFDYQLAGARLLGRDVARMAGPETRGRLIKILTSELRVDGQHRLIGQWGLREGEDETSMFKMLEHFVMGLEERAADS